MKALALILLLLCGCAANQPWVHGIPNFAVDPAKVAQSADTIERLQQQLNPAIRPLATVQSAAGATPPPPLMLMIPDPADNNHWFVTYLPAATNYNWFVQTRDSLTGPWRDEPSEWDGNIITFHKDGNPMQIWRLIGVPK